MKVLVVVITLFCLLARPVYAEPATIIDNVVTNEKIIALSIEDIRTEVELEKVIVLCETQKVKLTFFLAGQFIKENPLIVRKAFDKGYEFGNYGLTTRYWGKITKDEIMNELTETGAILQKTLGVAGKVVRPPYSSYEDSFLQASSASFLTVVRGLDTGEWTIDSPQAVVDKVKSTAASGSIVRINMQARHSADALPEVIRELSSMGYNIVTVSDLLAKAQPVPKPINVKPFRVVRQVSEASPKIALTFDDGGSSYRVNSILDVLRENGVKSTFFLSGDWADNNSNLLQSIAVDGHEIANHSYSHPVFSWLGTADIESELVSTEIAIRRGIGDEPRRYFRPPYGDYNSAVYETVKNLGYEAIVLWDVDTRDWSGVSSQTIINRVLNQVSGGSIVLFHLHANGTTEALRELIPMLRAQGYEMTTVGAMLE
ncbi:hypothetical protein SDC9_09109 [bioreactor metagenome]|uniref:NodB homology domain-containing protein n=1 Tax=bioreactor metagenome TaxID=1076179 RepID=A0A644T963_9ZZZZ|nr:polysaccharide deacetylase family protein [Negativicutes bacterium]